MIIEDYNESSGLILLSNDNYLIENYTNNLGDDIEYIIFFKRSKNIDEVPKYCRISIITGDYIGAEDENYILTEEEKELFINIVTERWEEILNDFLWELENSEEYRNKYLSLKIPDFSKLRTR